LSKNQKEHYEQDRLIDPVEAIVWCLITQEKDEIFLDSSQLNEKYLWSWHFEIFRKFGLVFSDKRHFVPAEQIYEAALLHAKPDHILVSRCFSFELQKHVEIDDLLESSRKANSKVEIIKNASKYNFQIPQSITAKKSLLTPEKVKSAFGDNHGALMLKADGMGGGYNVKEFTNVDELTQMMMPYASNTKFVVQKKIDESFAEFAADFVIYPDRVELLYYRFALMTDGGWQGNIFCPRLKMNAAQISNLFNCANAVRRMGYCSEQGFMCGIDFFQNEHIQYVTEINARWTVPAPYGFLLNKLNLRNLTVFLYKDMISNVDVRLYQEFALTHLYNARVELDRDQFAIMPLGLGPLT